MVTCPNRSPSPRTAERACCGTFSDLATTAALWRVDTVWNLLDFSGRPNAPDFLDSCAECGTNVNQLAWYFFRPSILKRARVLLFLLPTERTSTMARVVFTANLQRHVACPPAEVAGRTVREVLDAAFAGNER